VEELAMESVDRGRPALGELAMASPEEPALEELAMESVDRGRPALEELAIYIGNAQVSHVCIR
jgi:hypothetical protein